MRGICDNCARQAEEEDIYFIPCAGNFVNELTDQWSVPVRIRILKDEGCRIIDLQLQTCPPTT